MLHDGVNYPNEMVGRSRVLVSHNKVECFMDRIFSLFKLIASLRLFLSVLGFHYPCCWFDDGSLLVLNSFDWLSKCNVARGPELDWFVLI